VSNNAQNHFFEKLIKNHRRRFLTPHPILDPRLCSVTRHQPVRLEPLEHNMRYQ